MTVSDKWMFVTYKWGYGGIFPMCNQELEWEWDLMAEIREQMKTGALNQN